MILAEDLKMEFYSKIANLQETPDVKIELRNLVDGLATLSAEIETVINNLEADSKCYIK